MSTKIVLKVDIVGERCQAGAMSIVAKLTGVKSMTVDREKQTLTVVGDVDVVCVVNALRNAKFTVQVLSVGPAEEKKPEPPKKPDPPKPLPCCCSGACCNSCRPGMMPPCPVAGVCYDEQPGGGCVISDIYLLSS